MLQKYREGYDVVYARRIARKGETFFKLAMAWTFYRLMRGLVHRELPVDVGDFRLMSRPCLDALRSMKEMHRFLRGMVTWIGFPQTNVDFVRDPRAAGTTKYPFRKLFLLAWNGAISFSALPLRLSFFAGFAMLAVVAVYALYSLWKFSTGEILIPGWMSLIMVNCLTAGSLMLAVGILGEYVGRIFEEVKRRPLYVVSITANLPAESRVSESGAGGYDAVSETIRLNSLT
jgi:dolichol-phosphate mannosyltransferase